MMVILSRLYVDGAVARAVVDELKASGVPEDDIGIIAPSRTVRMENADLENADDMVDRDRDGRDDRGQMINRSAGIGAALGGAGGVGIGGSGGENDAAGYAEGVRRGGTLVTIRVMSQDREFYEDILASRNTRQVHDAFEPSGMPVQLRDLDGLRVKRP